MFGKTLSVALGAALLAAPAFAQSYPDRNRSGRVTDQVVRTIEETANAVGRVRDSLDRGINDVRWRGPERFAVDACRPYAERYGQVRVDDVRPYKRRSFRVYGTTSGYGRDYGRDYYGSRSRGYGPRAFTCTVQDDGRVKFKTKRLRRY
jgi:hypothetical protein